MTKMTYAQAIDMALEVLTDDVAIEKLEALKVQLAKRGSGKRGMTTTQKANVGIKDTIATVLLELDKPVTVTELIADERLHEYTNQKVSALLRQMIEEGRVVKTIEKKKAYFSVA